MFRRKIESKLALCLSFLLISTVAAGAQVTQSDKDTLTLKEHQFNLQSWAKSSTPDGKRTLSDPIAVNSWCYIDLLNNSGLKYDRIGDFANGEQAFLKALDLFKKAFGENHMETAYQMNQVAIHYERAGTPKIAEQYATKALAVQEKIKPNSIPVIFTLTTLMRTYLDEKRYAEAEACCKRQIPMAEKLPLGKNGPMVALVLEGYYDVLIASKRDKDAKEVAQRAGYIRKLTHTPPMAGHDFSALVNDTSTGTSTAAANNKSDSIKNIASKNNASAAKKTNSKKK